jgi:hypothetical protein
VTALARARADLRTSPSTAPSTISQSTAAAAYRIVVSGNALTLPSADFPTTNWPPHARAVVVAKIAPSAVVLVRMYQ